MNFRMKPVSIMGASPIAYMYMHENVAPITREYFFNLLSLKLIPPASINRQTSTESMAVLGFLLWTDDFCVFCDYNCMEVCM